MRLFILAAGQQDIASSRIRAFGLQCALRVLGHSVELATGTSNPEGQQLAAWLARAPNGRMNRSGTFRARSESSQGSPEADVRVLYVQKRVNSQILSWTQQAKRTGHRVVYDMDDIGLGLEYWAPQPELEQMVRLADCLTTDTAGHREQLMARHGAPRVEIVPDTIDYSPAHPVRPPIHCGQPLRVLWFGSVSNLPLFERAARALATLPQVQVVVATQPDGAALHAKRFTNVEFVPWTLESFPSVLQSCDLTCLMHDPASDPDKSNNRMIASITLGVPAIVSRTPEYARTAKEAGVESALFTDDHELAQAVERHRPPSARAAYLDRAQPAIWERYQPLTVARGFAALIERLYGDSAPRPKPERADRLAARPLSVLEFMGLTHP